MAKCAPRWATILVRSNVLQNFKPSQELPKEVHQFAMLKMSYWQFVRRCCIDEVLSNAAGIPLRPCKGIKRVCDSMGTCHCIFVVIVVGQSQLCLWQVLSCTPMCFNKKKIHNGRGRSQPLTTAEFFCPAINSASSMFVKSSHTRPQKNGQARDRDAVPEHVPCCTILQAQV